MAISSADATRLNAMCPAAKGAALGTDVLAIQTTADAALSRGGGTMTGGLIPSVVEVTTGAASITSAYDVVILGAGYSGSAVTLAPTGNGGKVYTVVVSSGTAASSAISILGGKLNGTSDAYALLDAQYDAITVLEVDDSNNFITISKDLS